MIDNLNFMILVMVNYSYVSPDSKNGVSSIPANFGFRPLRSDHALIGDCEFFFFQACCCSRWSLFAWLNSEDIFFLLSGQLIIVYQVKLSLAYADFSKLKSVENKIL